MEEWREDLQQNSGTWGGHVGAKPLGQDAWQHSAPFLARGLNHGAPSKSALHRGPTGQTPQSDSKHPLNRTDHVPCRAMLSGRPPRQGNPPFGNAGDRGREALDPFAGAPSQGVEVRYIVISSHVLALVHVRSSFNCRLPRLQRTQTCSICGRSVD
ncbi:hypothetical protein FDECE_16766 [Fusarium decemcellulare]|nr:hypothetical protein FDECE_16766 [Fusarium decemcellulare]